VDCFVIYYRQSGGGWKITRLSVGYWEAVGGISDGFLWEMGKRGFGMSVNGGGRRWNLVGIL
jgi:hypothetical protein